MFIGLTEPSGRCIAVKFRNIALMQTQIEHPHNTIIMFDSGICREVTETPAEIERIWLEKGSQPEPTAAATPKRPKTITVDELRVGDEMEIQGNRHTINRIDVSGDFEIFPSFPSSMHLLRNEAAEFLARGVQVYRDGKLISGWPVESPPDDFNWRDLCKSAEADVKKHEARIAELEAELAAIRSQPQEVPPLDPWRVLATARDITFRKSEDAVAFEGSVWTVANVALVEILAVMGGGAHEYPYK
jgi:hypothetical protein